jgi:hypothetical protein
LKKTIQIATDTDISYTALGVRLDNFDGHAKTSYEYAKSLIALSKIKTKKLETIEYNLAI